MIRPHTDIAIWTGVMFMNLYSLTSLHDTNGQHGGRAITPLHCEGQRTDSACSVQDEQNQPYSTHLNSRRVDGELGGAVTLEGEGVRAF